MIRKMLFLLPLSFLVVNPVNAQVDSTKRERKQGVDSTVVIGKGKIVYKGRIYRQNAPYLMLGYGLGYGFRTKGLEQNMSLAYHHFFNKIGIRIGYHASSDLPPWWRSFQKLNDICLGVGTRWNQWPRWNFAVFGGPTLAYGWYIAWNDLYQEERAFNFLTPGLHAEVQATFKPAYDLGIGLSVYGSVNRYYSVTGVQIHLFFSTAFIRNYD